MALVTILLLLFRCLAVLRVRIEFARCCGRLGARRVLTWRLDHLVLTLRRIPRVVGVIRVVVGVSADPKGGVVSRQERHEHPPPAGGPPANPGPREGKPDPPL